jgi:hypothetical protein
LAEWPLEKNRKMAISEKDLLAAEAMDRWEDFQESLSSEKRRYPIQQFRAFLVGSNTVRRIDEV